MKKSFYILSLGAITAFGGCTKNFEEINTNPVLLNKDLVRPEHIFTHAVKGFSFEVLTHSTISSYAGYYTNPASGNIFQEQNWDNPHNTYYRNYYTHIREVERLTANNPNRVNQHAIARIMKSMIFQIMTDLYGDLPYFEAALGVETAILQPKYDEQEDIYIELLKQVKEATEVLEANAPEQISFGNGEVFFKNNINNWVRVGNSLRLRMAMRVRYANPELAKEHINEVISKSLISQNSENMLLKSLTDPTAENQNPLYVKNLTSANNMSMSFTATDLLKKLSDPRLSVFARPSTTGGYRGLPLQILEETGGRYGNDSLSLMNTSFLQQVYSIVLLNAAEVKFLRAEAANAGITSENAQSLYADGIRLAMTQYGVGDAAITTYLSSAAGTLTGTEEEKLEQIINQKWLGIYYNKYEAYAEFRRTGYPRIWTGNRLGATNGQVPRRLTYPEAEFRRNEDNVREAIGRLESGNTMMSRVWWDQKQGLPKLHARQGMYPPEFD